MYLATLTLLKNKIFEQSVSIFNLIFDAVTFLETLLYSFSTDSLAPEIFVSAKDVQYKCKIVIVKLSVSPSQFPVFTICINKS